MNYERKIVKQDKLGVSLQYDFLMLDYDNFSILPTPKRCRVKKSCRTRIPTS